MPEANRRSVELVGVASVTLDPRINDIVVNFNWMFKEGIDGFDIDSSLAFVTQSLDPTDFIWWDNVKTKCGSALFVSGDNKAGEGGGTKESIKIKLQEVPHTIHFLVVAASVYSKDHSMEDIAKLSLDVESRTKTEFSYKVERCVFVTADRNWGCVIVVPSRFIGEEFFVRLLCSTITEIMHEPDNLTSIKEFKPVRIVRRHVTLRFVEGKNLTPMDFSLFRKRSDPYLKIFVDDKVTISQVCYGTLNPKIICDPIDLGIVSESSTKVVEVQCWDWDKFTAHDSMGANKFCLGGLMPKLERGVNKIWLKMHPLEEHAKSKTTVTGDILCEVIVREV